MATSPIQGKVARILSTRDLVINRGSEDGVAVGMIFDVLDPNAENISDPDTHEILGSVYRPKVQVKVSEVDERLAAARTFKATRVNLGGAGLGGIGNLRRALEPPRWVDRYETLRSDDAAWQPLSESQSYVKVGDPVIQVVPEDLEESGARTLPASEEEVPEGAVAAAEEGIPPEGDAAEA